MFDRATGDGRAVFCAAVLLSFAMHVFVFMDDQWLKAPSSVIAASGTRAALVRFESASRPIDSVATSSELLVEKSPAPRTPGNGLPAQANAPDLNGALGADLVPEAAPKAQTADGELVASDDQYLLRSQLTVPAALLTDVVVPYPDIQLAEGRHTMTLALFVDEIGAVRRVRVEGSAPAELEKIARQSFLDAVFRPGDLNGQPAKALVRVEVTFENIPMVAARIDDGASAPMRVAPSR